MIYMTTDEWKEISKLIVAKDFDKLAQEICVETYDLDISKQELDKAMKDYKTREPLKAEPTLEPEIKPGEYIPMNKGFDTLYEGCGRDEMLYLKQIFHNPEDYYVDPEQMRIYRKEK